MQHEAAQKLQRIDRAVLRAIRVRIVAPLERDLMFDERENTTIANRDSVRIAREIFENLLRTSEWRLHVRDPFLSSGAFDGDVRKHVLGKPL